MRFSRCYLEITNRCNLSCSFCPKTKRPARTLSPAEFRLLAEKIRPYTDYLYLHVLGEPLMHPQLEGLLDICRELSFRVVITTNGTLLPAQETMLLSSPALYKINVSLHSFEANAPGDFGAYLSGCFSFAKKSGEAGKLVDLRLWNLDGETTRGQNAQNDSILEALEAVFPQPWVRNTWGFRLRDRVFVHYAEKFDHEGDIALGNLFSQNLPEILDDTPAKSLLSGFSARKLSHPLCRRCGYAKRFR